ncbi:rho GTPase-activating protein 7 isoform X2 [Octopus sinensis]|uniref:Rho GTPase-activating protein 7 isoform X2 n=1 Tax=Octopus sinensis TaxID=2607531 RepID=A0A6P7T055_9MOLL|nr:rho GTPase-activating protein 7 isoform X2 [Octopus sinensis]
MLFTSLESTMTNLCFYLDKSWFILCPNTSVGRKIKGLEKRKREKLQAEIEAKEACKWLRYTGFPQYVQMFQDGQFPINTESVHNDHDFLDTDSLQALSRRLDILNRCSKVQIDTARSKTGDDSDEEEQCALSDKWKYQRSSRRWSRMGLQLYQKRPSDTVPPMSPVRSSSSHDSLLTDQDSYSHLENSLVNSAPTDHDTKQIAVASLDFSGSSEPEGDKILTELQPAKLPTVAQALLSPKLGRASSFRPARLITSRFGSKKNGGSMRNKKQMDCLQISGPIVMETDNMKETIRRMNCIDLDKKNKHMMTRSNSTDCSSSECTSQIDFSSASSPDLHLHTTTAQSKQKSELFQPRTLDNYSDNHSISKNALKNNNSNNLTEVYLLPSDYKPGSFPKVINNGYIETGEGHGINFRTGSFSLGHDSKQDSSKYLCAGSQNDRSKRVSIYDNVPLEESVEAELDEIVRNLYENITGFTKYVGSENSFDLETEISLLKDLKSLDNLEGTVENEQAEIDSQLLLEDKPNVMTVESDAKESSKVMNTELTSSSDSDVESEPVMSRERLDSGVGSSLTRPSSLKKHNRIRWYSFQKSHRPSFSSKSAQICTLSVRQIHKLQSVCMLTITTLMEKFSPANRSGWNWTVSRFIKKVKEPDYKDKKVFGVPLIETLRRSGQPVPQCILYAMKYLRSTAKDADGIFRRSGVKSRIQNIREQIELNTEMVAFTSLQSYDVADLTKQYFRELPECLLTNKLSETFIGVFTHFPKEHWLEAVNATIILMPDENREVLQSLLLFLHDISKTADHHKMTASNLAVCFAPSLFNVISLKSTNSPSLLRNKKQIGVPDSKEVLEPAHECLVFMIENSKSLFSVPQETIAKCRFSVSDIHNPMEIKDFDHVNGKPNLFIDKHYQVLFKECREKFRNWNVCPSINGIDIAYKKTDDLLRQWMCLTEMEAPPEEVLNRILTERSLWDEDLNGSGVVEKLDNHTDIFQYTRNSMPPHPCRHYCLIRSWRTDLSKGACLLLTHSVRHPKVKISGVEGIILESHYLIEPCGAGKSRVTHIIREDTKGRSVKWYNLSYGKINANFMDRLRTSFQQVASGPETKL